VSFEERDTEMQTSPETLDGVKAVLIETLGIGDRASALGPETPLFGAIPELDSLAVVEVITGLEERFAFQIDDDEFSGEVFESIGSLAAFVDRHRPQ
jgi:acyl carrier protein